MARNTRPLPCRLTDDEVAERAARMAERLVEFQQLDEQRIEDGKRYRESMKEIRDEVQTLAQEVYSRTTVRAVECTESPDHAKGLVHVVREDTGEVVHTRPTTADERQISLLPTPAPARVTPRGVEVPAPPRDEDGDEAEYEGQPALAF